jgi:hypothetical protein
VATLAARIANEDMVVPVVGSVGVTVVAVIWSLESGGIFGAFDMNLP